MSILESFKLDGKVALVTGANRGLGQAMAIALAEAGADVIGISRASEAPKTATPIAATGQTYTHLQADLLALDGDGCKGLIQQAVSVHGKLDILLNNAGIVRRNPIFEFTESDWDDVIHVNLKAVFFLAQAAAQHMKGRGGKIINIASLFSYQGGFTVPSYTASKHGVMGMTRAMANELAPHGINVNAIALGYMATDITEALQNNPERNAAILARIPAGNWGNPDDLKGAAVFLASAASDYMHGATIDVDGGWMGR